MKNVSTQKIRLKLIAKGLLVGQLVILIGTMLISMCVDRGLIDINNFRYTVPIVWLTSAFVTAYIEGDKEEGMGLYIPIAISIAQVLLIALIGFVVYGNIDSLMVLFATIAYVIGSGLAILLKQKRNISPRKYRHRMRAR